MRVLVVGDLHSPFIKSGYLSHCKKIYKKYKCTKVVFIGDLVDSHFSSFHEIDPDGHSAGEELRLAKKMISKWYETFPNSYVCLGNHDNIVDRKRFNAGLSEKWIRTIDEVLEVPTWKFADYWIFDNVKYIHGLGGSAKTRMLNEQISIVQGHYHKTSYIVWNNDNTFALQIGCGIDEKSYAMNYAKYFGQVQINCGVVINGRLPIIEYM